MNAYAVKLVSSTGKVAHWSGEAVCLMDALSLARNVDFPEHVRSRAEVLPAIKKSGVIVPASFFSGEVWGTWRIKETQP